MEVFKEKEIVDLDGGHKLEVNLVNFIEAEKLFTAVVNCYQKGIEGISLLTVNEVKLALLPCIQKCSFDNEPIKDLSFFENINRRQFYMPICMKVIEINTAPFMTSPL